MRLEGRSAIVTGSARGIGQAIAVALAGEGARVVIADILDGAETIEKAEQAAEQAGSIQSPKGAPVVAVYQKTDLQEEGQIVDLVKRAEKEFGGLDIMVNDAAVQYEKTLEETTVEDLDHLWRVNLRGVLLCCKHGAQAMVRRGHGAIVNIASVMGMVGDPTLVGYSATKGGVIATTTAVAASFAARGVRCNAIAPGDVDTYLSHVYWEQFDNPRGARAEVEALYPMHRFAQPEEIARIAVFLASDDASAITGVTLRADCGLLSPVYQGRSMS
jgi:NAD(P)-dependent dehydrogenase (short-subunit alcohol dehydrogenase family)